MIFKERRSSLFYRSIALALLLGIFVSCNKKQENTLSIDAAISFYEVSNRDKTRKIYDTYGPEKKVVGINLFIKNDKKFFIELDNEKTNIERIKGHPGTKCFLESFESDAFASGSNYKVYKNVFPESSLIVATFLGLCPTNKTPDSLSIAGTLSLKVADTILVKELSNIKLNDGQAKQIDDTDLYYYAGESNRDFKVPDEENDESVLSPATEEKNTEAKHIASNYLTIESLDPLLTNFEHTKLSLKDSEGNDVFIHGHTDSYGTETTYSLQIKGMRNVRSMSNNSGKHEKRRVSNSYHIDSLPENGTLTLHIPTSVKTISIPFDLIIPLHDADKVPKIPGKEHYKFFHRPE